MLTIEPPQSQAEPPDPWLFLAMSYHRQEHFDEAQQWFKKASAWNDDVMAKKDTVAQIRWYRRVFWELLYKEASELVNIRVRTPRACKSARSAMPPFGMMR